jgi:hypothetical protein
VQAQAALQFKMYSGLKDSWTGYQQVAAMRALVSADTTSTPAEVVTAAKAFDSTLLALSGNPEGRSFSGFGRAGPPPNPSFVSVNGGLVQQVNDQENGDMAPTPAMQAGYVAACKDLGKAITAWMTLNGAPLAAFNAVLTKNSLKPVPATTPTLTAPVCEAPAAPVRRRAAAHK